MALSLLYLNLKQRWNGDRRSGQPNGAGGLSEKNNFGFLFRFAGGNGDF
jgi:hypothetical protein